MLASEFDRDKLGDDSDELEDDDMVKCFYAF